jgi:predicted permease
MNRLRSLLLRLVSLFRKRRADRDFDAEMEAHLGLHIADNLRAGMTPEQARREALLKLGGLEQTKELVRQRRTLPAVEIFLQDLRFAARLLHKNPGFASVVILTIALGVGANTAIFSIVNAVLLRPLNYPQPQTLVRVYTYNAERADMGATFPDFLDWRLRNHSFSDLAATWPNDANLFDRHGPEKIRTAIATANLFTVLGIQPLYGRLFRPSDDRLGYQHVVLLSFALWQRRFAGDPSIVGKPVTIDNSIYFVAGVLPSGFEYPEKTELWLPMGVGEEGLIAFHDHRRIHAMDVLGRLQPGVAQSRAAVDMSVVMDQLAKEYPDTNSGWHTRLVSLEEDTVGASRRGLLLLMGAAGFVLLTACANIVSLLLARGAVRAKEYGVRLALGGSPGRLTQQLVTESVLLGMLGGLAGVALAWAGHTVILFMLPPDLPRIGDIRMDAWTFAFAFCLSLITGIACGLLPALRGGKANLQIALRASGRTSSARNPLFQKLLIVAEIACAFVLVTGAALLTQSFVHLLRVHPGYSVDHISAGTIGFPDSYASEKDRILFAKHVIGNLQNTAGVSSAAGTSLLPLVNFKRQVQPVQPAGEAFDPRRGHETNVTIVTPEFFQTMRIPLISGRLLEERDSGLQSGPVVISETAAHNLWPGQNPLGRHLQFAWYDPQDREVIGVVGDVKQSSLAAPSIPELYLPFYGVGYSYLTFLVRTEGDPRAFGKTLADKIHEVDPTMAVYDVGTLAQSVSESVRPNRFYLRLIGTFGLTALVLAAIGIYGLVSFGVAQRTREMGIRLSLGALPAGLLKMILGQGLRLALSGMALGFAGSLALTRLLSGLLFEVTPSNPVALLLSALLLLACALLACWVPARRAMRVDPIMALRHE